MKFIQYNVQYNEHGRLARWRKWKSYDVGEAKEGLENELWRRWSNGRVGEWVVTWVKRWKGWRMSCDVGEVTDSLENQNELWRRWSDWKLGEWAELIALISLTPCILKLKWRLRDNGLLIASPPALPSGCNCFSRSRFFGAVAPRLWFVSFYDKLRKSAIKLFYSHNELFMFTRLWFLISSNKQY